MKRVGLLGGSFNPAHRGHLRASLAMMRALGLDEIWWLVSPGNVLKPAAGMAPLAARLLSARRIARGAPIKVSVIERELGTVYTVDSVQRIVRRWPGTHFCWLMGADNLAQFHRWRRWRLIARTLPIAVITRPGYDRRARMARAMSWLRRFVRPARQARNWTRWSLPGLVLLRMPPDRTSATALRAADPGWHESFNAKSAPRDHVTRAPFQP